jgi:periplasmic divalent cation tolerance protein
MSNTTAIVVLMTAATHEEAAKIADHLVKSRLAACVQMLSGIESIYWWQETIERSSEILLLAKTTQDKFEELEAVVRSLHSYDTPEIIALPITAGSAPYLAWLAKNVSE